MPRELKSVFRKTGKSGYVIIVKDYSILESTAEQECIQKERELMFQLHVWIVIIQLVISLN
jgi:hypothetical protein